MKDYYASLHIKPDATVTQIDAAYRRLMQRYHPQARSTPQASDRLRELNEAWRVLSDPGQRAAYDRARANGMDYQPPAPPPSPRALPQSAQAEFGARRSTGGTCLVALGVVLVLVFALGIFGWGLNEQLNLGGVLQQWGQDFNAVLPVLPTAPTSVAETDVTPTPDPRCRDGCETPPPGCVVKGNVESDGSRYFYLPNDVGYADVVVNTAGGDRWFCAMNDAQSAGWTRKAPTPTPTMPPPADTSNTQVARRTYAVCQDTAALRQGPSEDYGVVQNLDNGAKVAVTGINGDYSVVTLQNGIAYIRTDALCAPTRAAPRATSSTAQGTGPANAQQASETPAPGANPVASAAGGNFKYAAPLVVAPSNGSKYWCSHPLILQWAFPGTLADGEYFLIESKADERDNWVALADWTRDTNITLNPVRGPNCDALWWANTGVYDWRISVVTGSKTTPTYLSPFSTPSIINYAK